MPAPKGTQIRNASPMGESARTAAPIRKNQAAMPMVRCESRDIPWRVKKTTSAPPAQSATVIGHEPKPILIPFVGGVSPVCSAGMQVAGAVSIVFEKV